MAQKKVPDASGNKKKQAAGAKKPAPRKKAEPEKAPEREAAQNPHRREIGAAVCLLLSLFGIIGFFTGDGVFISFFARFLKALMGYGFYVAPFALLWCAYILAFHRGRPVILRVTCTLVLCPVLGALIHIFAGSPALPFDKEYVKTIWASGLAVRSGGLIAGTLAIVLKKLFTSVGAVLILLIALALLGLGSADKTIAEVVAAFKSRPRRKYVYPEQEDEPALQESPRPAREQKRRQDAPVPEQPVQPARSEQAPFTITGVEPARGVEPKKPYLEELGDAPPPTRDDAPDGIPFMDQQLRRAPKPTHSGKVSLPTVDGGRRESKSGEPELITPPSRPTVSPPEPLRRPQRPLETVAEPELERPVQEEIPFVPMEQSVPGTEPELIPEPVQEPAAEAEDAAETAQELELAMSAASPKVDTSGYIFPPVELLEENTATSREQEDVWETSQRLESSFRSFGVNVKITDYTCGPAVTRYEAELEPGIKLSKITNLAADIALSIGASGVRIAAMPNKISTVGIEVPNRHVSSVYLREIIESDAFTKAKSRLTFAIGRSIAGEAIVGNIAKLPHLLVAGTTGSGKSVCLNSMMLSILYKARPDEVRFIMVDPKMVEFKVYNGIPHLLIPVVTDAKKASGALQWAVTEMLKRYRLFAETTARDLAGYNEYVEKLDDPERPKLPQIVIFIDELADLMMIAKKEVEDSIVRIAQMGRAAGMHLVVATQSPRADVITGLMKANIPSRIALKVSNSLESRIILDAGGNADKLVGNGDMLYAPIGTNEPIRIQGTWVSDAEREAVIEFVKNQGETDYSQDVIRQIENAALAEETAAQTEEAPAGAEDYDELLPQAVEVVFESKQASSSMLQRRLKVGYTRAARLIDQMEEIGVVGPFEGSKPRQLLITYQQWQEMQFLHGTAPSAALPQPDDFSNPDFADGD